MRYTYEDLIAHPELIEELHKAAHRERAAAAHRLLIAPLKRALDGTSALRADDGAAPVKAHC